METKVSFRDIIEVIGADTKNVIDLTILGVSAKSDPKPNTISFSTTLSQGDIEIIIANPETIFLIPQIEDINAPKNTIPSTNPRRDYGIITRRYFDPPRMPAIEISAHIADSAKIGEGCYIGHNVVIEDGVVVGNNSIIEHNSVVRRGTTIGHNCSVGSNTSIGGPGFGYDIDENGDPFRIPHLGNVTIGDYVDIGSNVSIARGTIGNTIISDYVKVDDCAFIAHNVKIGRASYIIAGAEISGSVTIGENVWISPEVTVINKVNIGDNSLVGIGSTVTKSIEPGMIAVGSPAKSIRKRYDR